MVRCGEATGKRRVNKRRRTPVRAFIMGKVAPVLAVAMATLGRCDPDEMNGTGQASVFHLLDGHHLGHVVAQHVFDPVLQGGP
jgi:hypothetical protein